MYSEGEKCLRIMVLGNEMLIGSRWRSRVFVLRVLCLYSILCYFRGVYVKILYVEVTKSGMVIGVEEPQGFTYKHRAHPK